MSRTLRSLSDTQYTNVGSHSRRREPREVTFLCECCQEVKTELRLPAATPKYCQACAPEIKRKQATERQQRHRAAVKTGDVQAGVGLSPAERKKNKALMKAIAENTAGSDLKRGMEVIKYMDYLKAEGKTEQAEELKTTLNKNVKQGYDLMIKWILDL